MKENEVDPVSSKLVFVGRFHGCFRVQKHDTKIHAIRFPTEEDRMNVTLSW